MNKLVSIDIFNKIQKYYFKYVLEQLLLTTKSIRTHLNLIRHDFIYCYNGRPINKLFDVSYIEPYIYKNNLYRILHCKYQHVMNSPYLWCINQEPYNNNFISKIRSSSLIYYNIFINERGLNLNPQFIKNKYDSYYQYLLSCKQIYQYDNKYNHYYGNKYNHYYDNKSNNKLDIT